MMEKPQQVREGILLFEGKISFNLIVDPMISHTYFLEDGNQVILFDPSCGKAIGRRVEGHIRRRREESASWDKAFVIAGHSHLDHANNFYLADKLGAPETHVYVHESGFRDGKVMNDPAPFVRDIVRDSNKHYNLYLSFFFPYNLLLAPLALLNLFSSDLASTVFSALGSLAFPSPNDGNASPETLKEVDKKELDVGGIKLAGWPLDDKVVLPTPGHSPCSVSLLWPAKKALFISDADWAGNPVFIRSSLRDCISSFETMKALTDAGVVDLLLPAHGTVKEGADAILCHLDFHIRRLETIRNEILAIHHDSGVRDVRQLTKTLVRHSPLFRLLKGSNFPRFVCFVHNVVALCLIEEGILTAD
jgi:glyoxylase-like metal-dependent hydrolase (beta-lactamase superfamily II)